MPCLGTGHSPAYSPSSPPSSLSPFLSDVEAALLQNFVHGREWIFPAVRHFRRQLRKARFASGSAQSALEQTGLKQLDQAVLPMLDVFALPLSPRFNMLSNVH